MKKLAAYLLITAFLICSTGCSARSNDIENSVNYYYLRTKVEYNNIDSIIVPTVADVTGYEDNYEYFIRQYLSGPSEGKLISPFPDGTQLLSLTCETNRIEITLSAHMAEIDGISAIVAFACLTRTLAEMTGTQTIQIQIDGHQINGADSITLSPNNFSYWDTVTPAES